MIANKLAAFAMTSLSLVGLYLVLRNAFGASRIIGAVSSGAVSIFRTLQGR